MSQLNFHPDCDASRQQSAKDAVAWWESGQSHLTIATSGSTGEPKNIDLNRQGIEASIAATERYAEGLFHLDRRGRTAICLDMHHVAGLFSLFRGLAWGWDIDVFPIKRQPDLQGKYDWISLIPQQAMALTQDQWQGLSVCLLGGGPLSNLERDHLASQPCRIIQGYGMTETYTHIALKRLMDERYQCLPGVSVTADDSGCLIIDCPDRGIRNLLTTDLVDLQGCGRFQWLGRADDVILSAGKKIHPQVVENSLQKHWSHRGFLVALDHQQWGQAAVWLSEPLEDFDVQQWQKALAHLPSWQRPKAFVQCLLPLTGSGKWDRRKGRSMAQELALL